MAAEYGIFCIDNYGKLICPVRKSRSKGVKIYFFI